MHFLLLVTNTDKYNLEEQLEPFDGNKIVEKHIVHTKAELIEEAKQKPVVKKCLKDTSLKNG